MSDTNRKRWDFFDWSETWVNKMRRFLLAEEHSSYPDDELEE